jgi:hypothetical protein
MNVTLPSDQQKWLEAEVAAGRFQSIDVTEDADADLEDILAYLETLRA